MSIGKPIKYRNPILVIVFSIITFGIYEIVWHVKTKIGMNAAGAQIPTAWLIIIPFANLWWLWKYVEGVEFVTRKNLTAPIAFMLMFLLDSLGNAIIQSEFNKVSK